MKQKNYLALSLALGIFATNILNARALETITSKSSPAEIESAKTRLTATTILGDKAFILKNTDTPQENDFTLQKYLYNIDTSELTPVGQVLSYNNPLGDEGDIEKYFKWQDTESGRELVESSEIIGNDVVGKTPINATLYGYNLQSLDDKSVKNRSFLGLQVSNYDLNGVLNNSGLVHSSGSGINFSTSTIDYVASDFIGNYNTSIRLSHRGIAISNYSQSIPKSVTEGIIGNINGSFVGNNATSKNSNEEVLGVAIYNANTSRLDEDAANVMPNEKRVTNASIANITGNFVGNYAKVYNDRALGAAIYNKTDL